MECADKNIGVRGWIVCILKGRGRLDITEKWLGRSSKSGARPGHSCQPIKYR